MMNDTIGKNFQSFFAVQTIKENSREKSLDMFS